MAKELKKNRDEAKRAWENATVVMKKVDKAADYTGSRKAHDEAEKLRFEYLKAEKVSETDADAGTRDSAGELGPRTEVQVDQVSKGVGSAFRQQLFGIGVPRLKDHLIGRPYGAFHVRHVRLGGPQPGGIRKVFCIAVIDDAEGDMFGRYEFVQRGQILRIGRCRPGDIGMEEGQGDTQGDFYHWLGKNDFGWFLIEIDRILRIGI